MGAVGPPGGLRRKRGRHAGFAAAAVCLGWTLIECGSAASGVWVPGAFRDRQRLLYEFFEPDPVLGFRAKANLRDFEIRWSETGEWAAYSTDAEGFRNVGRDPAEARILFLGDSFAWGVWLERKLTFPDLLERRLGVAVANWARESYGIEQYALLAERFLAAHDPDVVAVCIYANDLTKPISTEQLADFYDAFGWSGFARYPWRKRTVLHQVWERIESAWRARNAAPSHLDFAETSDGVRLYRGLGAHPWYESAGYDKAIEGKYADMLRRIAAAGAVPAVFLLPSKESVYFRRYAELFDESYLGIEERAYARLVGIARAQGAAALDLTPAFRSAGRQPAAYFAIDPHWNAAGHALAAKHMAAALEAVPAARRQASGPGAEARSATIGRPRAAPR